MLRKTNYVQLGLLFILVLTACESKPNDTNGSSPIVMQPDSLPITSPLPSPITSPTATELILTSEYWAGQDFIDVYHFRYDPKKQSMILQSTDQVKPNVL